MSEGGWPEAHSDKDMYLANVRFLVEDPEVDVQILVETKKIRIAVMGYSYRHSLDNQEKLLYIDTF